MNILSLLPQYEDYLRHERGLRPSSVVNYICDLRLYGELETRPVNEITLDDLRAYQRALGKKGLHTVTIRKKIYCFSTFWKWLKIEGYVQDVLPKLLTLPRKRETPPKFLQPAELLRFAQTPDTHPDPRTRRRNQLCWLTMAWLGLRRSEILNLRSSDVHLGGINSIMIQDGKSSDFRSLPLMPKLAMAYSQWLGDWTNVDYVFHTRPGQGWSKQAFMNAFNAQLAACGLNDGGITPHTIRHSCATMLLHQKVDIVIISKILGHKRIDTTMRYLSIVPDHLSQAMASHMLNRT